MVVVLLLFFLPIVIVIICRIKLIVKENLSYLLIYQINLNRN